MIPGNTGGCESTTAKQPRNRPLTVWPVKAGSRHELQGRRRKRKSRRGRTPWCVSATPAYWLTGFPARRATLPSVILTSSAILNIIL
jgi:hypothetical protein